MLELVSIEVFTHALSPSLYPLLINNNVLSEGGYAKGYLRRRKQVTQGWKGRTFVCGNWCYKSQRKKNQLAFFYSEKFQVNADPPTMVNIFLQVRIFTHRLSYTNYCFLSIL